MNQVIRIIFDDPITKERADAIVKYITFLCNDANGNLLAAIEVYEEEFTDEENKDGEEQRQGTK